ncbi:LysR family transcriptional regulator [Paenibacillus sp. SSG-1]|uniref:LysR family transcriptional regulator n=1 Tax=Paenibacillus sp. SSG-1 TaxID=1443669 RepID=UPI000B7F389B|nr:LysR family transcriptional regulator [Paenibacillus sp. SSG-1]OXL82159.1 LysR family transcriptional regulator [Paenibacillus sp. SSG-1]
MDIRQLRYFTIIVEEKQISAAARRLHMSQPPLSQQLKALEDELGSALVERSGKHLELTEAGKALYSYALKLLQLMDEAKTEVQEIGSGFKGVLRIGINTLSSVDLPDTLMRFKENYPQVTYKIQQNESAQLCSMVKSRVLELAIIRLPLALDEFSVLHLNTEPFYLMASRRLIPEPLAPEIPLEQIRNYPLILPSTEGLGVHYTVLMACAKHRFEPRIIAECSDIPLLLSLVSSGFGAAVVPETIVKLHTRHDVQVARIADPDLTSPYALIWLKEHHLSQAARHFIDMISPPASRE